MLRFAPQMPLRGMRTFRTSCKVLFGLGEPKERKQPQGVPKKRKSEKCAQEGMLRFAPQMPLRGMRTFARCARKDAPSLGAKQNAVPTRGTAFCVARPGGFEPSTYRFVAGHSIH